MLNKFIFLIIDLYQKVYFFDLDQIINFSTFLVVGSRIITKITPTKNLPFPSLFSPLIPYRYCGRMIGMKKILVIVALGLFITSQVQAKVKTKDINFPGKFYTTEITFCKAMKDTPTFTDSFSIKKVKGLIGYDWHADWEANSTSMNLQSKRIRVPIEALMAGTQNAISNNNQANIDIAKNLLIDLAKADTLYDSIGFYEVKKKPMCYANGDINAP